MSNRSCLILAVLQRAERHVTHGGESKIETGLEERDRSSPPPPPPSPPRAPAVPLLRACRQHQAPMPWACVVCKAVPWSHLQASSHRIPERPRWEGTPEDHPAQPLPSRIIKHNEQDGTQAGCGYLQRRPPNLSGQ